MAKTLRQDITGLRAIAVLAVTLFHIDHVMLPQINLFKGGFLGVDIFFPWCRHFLRDLWLPHDHAHHAQRRRPAKW